MPHMKVCEIFTNPQFMDFNIRKKESISDSEVMFTTLINKSKIGSNVDVALKVWLNWDEIPDKQISVYKAKVRSTLPPAFATYIDERLDFIDFLRGLNYEVLMYKFITSKIIEPNLSPNFIPILAYGKCSLKNIMDNVINSLPKDKSGQMTNFFKPLSVFPDLNLNIMITGTNRTNITSFTDILNQDKLNNNLDKKERSSIIFQCLYSLCLMDFFKISHNDLHLGNLLMEVLDSPTCFTFKFGNNNVSFRTRYIPKFYDWDRGFQKSNGDNPVLDSGFSLVTNALNKFTPNRDYYQFICEMNQYPMFWELLAGILSEPDYKSWRYAEGGDAVDHILSLSSSNKLKDYVKLHKSSDNIITGTDGYYITMDHKDVLETLTTPEISKIFSYVNASGKKTLDKFTHSKALYFGTDKKFKTITSFTGFNCQSLHIPSEKLLINLPLLFGNIDYFNSLTFNLEKCDKKEVSNDKKFIFPN